VTQILERRTLLLVLVILATVPGWGQQKREDADTMNNLSPQQKILGREILAQQVPEARATAEKLGPAAGPVLLTLAKHEKARIRLLVLELAPLAPSVDTSRAVIGLVQDSNSNVRSVAIGDLAVCWQKEVVPDLLKVLEKQPDPDLTTAVIRQIGLAGSDRNIGDLRPYESAREQEVAHQAALAMARLGDGTERKKIIDGLAALNPQVRVQALRDCQYIGDKTLIRYFGPTLDDIRDFMVITPPHIEPVVTARVCDIAVQTMAYMGLQFSFQAQFLARRTVAELEEAKRMVAKMAATSQEIQP